MKLFYYDHARNFGDDLNLYLWPRLLPKNFLDEDESELFVGIGSILWDFLPKEPMKYVVGSGYGAYTAPPNVNDGSWDVRFVRGPKTASALGIRADKSICDAAVLLRGVELPEVASQSFEISFMPHFDSIDRGNWKEACRLAGVHLLDPTLPCAQILSEIRATKLLITEAMHGAIVADALRVPWIAVEPLHHPHRFKWYDWAASLDIDYQPQKLWPSSMRELWTRTTGGQGKGKVTRFLAGKAAYPANMVMARIAAQGLQSLSRRPPQLSSDAAIERASDRSLSTVDLFVRQRKSAA
ncbi:polysaccharide pyruvyl transferase family protein [Pararhizobium sp. IMCC21322]|uniref:polysaccharide pyruvyl transferase family protein n=1 Tax=Pararhizobium sp. IMCC21322 TaxID=3067903 RepID=UPI002741B948|nr:polysaccharide pyruvyl transferase family protein [Pararhizobium sp. IMCC21322]